MLCPIRITKMPRRTPPRADILRFGTEKAAEAAAFHRTIPGYAPTPLVRLPGLARKLGLGDIYVKDESHRFGLNAFKGLGGSFAMDALGKQHPGKLTFVTATDGNHGRGVAWAAARLGHEAHVLLPRGTAPERLQNILALGAEAEITDLGYDDTVRYAAEMARQRGWILIQDTAWTGYEEIPALIMQGYTTMGHEIARQLGEIVPTHVFLQAGVGAMAGAMTAFFADCYGARKPLIAVTEPAGADCIFRSAEAGALRFCPGPLNTAMAGLSCGEPCTLGWEILRDHAAFSLSCPDETAFRGMRLLGRPLPGDPAVISGESGAVTLGAAAQIMTDPACAPLRAALGLDESSVLLCISTEGDTDSENYRRILSGELTSADL